MNKYDFIRFGDPVQWFDGSTDTLREMLVCCPVDIPVKADTRIDLIPMKNDDDDPEGENPSYSARADELVPWLSPFQEGYWEAVLDAEKSGADRNVLLAMLKTLKLSLMECVYLMLQSNACKLLSVLCQLFPEVEDMFTVITWEYDEYFARKLTIFRGTDEEMEILVSVTSLENRLIDNETGEPVSDEAEAVDNEIYYYLTDEEMRLSEERLVSIVESA